MLFLKAKKYSDNKVIIVNLKYLMAMFETTEPTKILLRYHYGKAYLDVKIRKDTIKFIEVKPSTLHEFLTQADMEI